MLSLVTWSSTLLLIMIRDWNLFLIVWSMLRFIWAKENLLVLDGRKELYKYLIHINLSRLSTIALSIISDLWIRGLRVSFKVTANSINGLMIEMESGWVRNSQFLLILHSMIWILKKMMVKLKLERLWLEKEIIIS